MCGSRHNYNYIYIYWFVFPASDAATSGVVYERWGRTDCPNGAEVVYSGFMGSGWFDSTGNGGEYLCLPEDPDYVDQSIIPYGFQSYIYSTEYRTEDLVFSNPTQLYDAPCAVCLAPRFTKIMIPAKASCPNSWTMEYTGYLMSSSFDNESSKNYVCVDGYAETLFGSQENTKGALLYFVTTICDTSFLPCLPYIKDVPFTCVVCTL